MKTEAVQTERPSVTVHGNLIEMRELADQLSAIDGPKQAFWIRESARIRAELARFS